MTTMMIIMMTKPKGAHNTLLSNHKGENNNHNKQHE